MSDSFQPQMPDKARLHATVVGSVTGLLAMITRGFMVEPVWGIPPAQLQLGIVLLLAMLAGIGAVVLARVPTKSGTLARGIGGRMGMQAGLFAVLFAGAALTLFAVLAANAAPTTAIRDFEKMRAWSTLGVSLASLLPAVLFGFIGGMLGIRIAAGRSSAHPPEDAGQNIPWLKWFTRSLTLVSVAGLSSPLWFPYGELGANAPSQVSDIAQSAEEPAFLYTSPQRIADARIGEIQPDVTQIISDLQSDAPVTLSVDGRLLAYCDTSGSAVSVYDLNRFQKIASIPVPATPKGDLAWSPDQKSLACLIGDRGESRLWILSITDGRATVLPRPPNGDTPEGGLVWWQENELTLYAADEPPLAFDLQKLRFTPLDASPYFTKLDEAGKKRWLEPPRPALPGQKGWKLQVRTVIRSVTPPPRRNPESAWEMTGESLLAMAHPQLPLAFGFSGLPVETGTRVLCTADGSKLIRIANGRAAVTYMKLAAAPEQQFEVRMPCADSAVTDAVWKECLEARALCVLVCDPLVNPLNHQVVGPDYQKVQGIAQLVEWKGYMGVFALQTYGGPIGSKNVAAVLHTWDAGRKEMWRDAQVSEWWTAIQPVKRDLPASLAEVYVPRLLALDASTSPFGVVTAADTPPPSWRKVASPGLPLTNVTPSLSPGSTLGSFSQVPIVVPPPKPALGGIAMAAGSAASAPPSTTQITEAEVQAFIMEHHAKASRGDVAALAADYDHKVTFLDKGQLSPAQIQEEEAKDRAKWPKGGERITSQPVVVEDAARWLATYTIEFYRENVAGDWHSGSINLSLTIRAEGTRLLITAQKAKVYDLQSGRRR